MNIKELLIPTYLNDVEAQDANIQETQANTQNILSAANLNNTQANRINSLLPGELAAQGLENEGLGIQNEGARITNKGNEILNIINTAKIKQQELTNKQLEMQIGYMDADKELERTNLQAEIQVRRAQAGQAAAATKQILGEADAQTRELMMQQYPKVASTMKWVSELYGKGDIAGANQLYQSLLKTLPPEFLQFEGKSGVDLLGPELTEEDDPKIIDMFAEYAAQLVPQDSQMGNERVQAQADAAAMERQKSQNAAGIQEAGIRARAESIVTPEEAIEGGLDREKKAREIVVPQLAGAIVGNKVAQNQLFDKNGNPTDPIIAGGFNELADFASKMKAAGNDVTQAVSKQFTIGDLDYSGIGTLKNVIVPTVPRREHRGSMTALESFLSDMDASMKKDDNLSADQAYQKVLRERITAYIDLFE